MAGWSSDAGHIKSAVTLEEVLPVHSQVVHFDERQQDEAFATGWLQHLNTTGLKCVDGHLCFFVPSQGMRSAGNAPLEAITRPRRMELHMFTFH